MAGETEPLEALSGYLATLPRQRREGIINQVIQRMKSRSSDRVQQEFPASKKPVLGNATSGQEAISQPPTTIFIDDVILQYLENRINDATDASRSAFG